MKRMKTPREPCCSRVADRYGAFNWFQTCSFCEPFIANKAAFRDELEIYYNSIYILEGYLFIFVSRTVIVSVVWNGVGCREHVTPNTRRLDSHLSFSASFREELHKKICCSFVLEIRLKWRCFNSLGALGTRRWLLDWSLVRERHA